MYINNDVSVTYWGWISLIRFSAKQLNKVAGPFSHSTLCQLVLLRVCCSWSNIHRSLEFGGAKLPVRLKQKSDVF